MGTWRKTYPIDSSKISEIPSILQDNFDAIEDAYILEHHGPMSSDSASGTHRLGAVGAVYPGTTAAITALSPSAGALAYDTTLGTFVRYNGTAWVLVGDTLWSRVRAYRSSNVVVTAGASAEDLICDVTTGAASAGYDTLSEYSTAGGTFTAKASGYYIVSAQVSLATSATITDSGYEVATSQTSATWVGSGSSTNWQNIDEYPTATDTDANYTQTVNATDIFAGTFPSIPSGSSGISLILNTRTKRSGCICYLTCYLQTCTCESTCYEFSCTCNHECYLEDCTCNDECYGQNCGCYQACYLETPSCTCDFDFYYMLEACTCFNTCYQETCTCNDSHYEYSGCSCNWECYEDSCTCDVACHGHNLQTIAPVIKVGSTLYSGSVITPSTSWVTSQREWTYDPSDPGSAAWTTSSVTAVTGFGYRMSTASAGTSLSAYVSQCYLSLSWLPTTPVFSLHLLKNGTIIQSTYQPLSEEGTSTIYQTVPLGMVVYLDAGDVLKLQYTKTIENDVIYGNSAYTFFTVHRLPVDFL